MFISLPVCPLSGRKNNKIEFFYRFYYRFAVTAVVILVELVFEGSGAGPVVRFVVENAKTGTKNVTGTVSAASQSRVANLTNYRADDECRDIRDNDRRTDGCLAQDREDDAEEGADH